MPPVSPDERMPHPQGWLNALPARMAAQMRFLVEADHLKRVVRGSRIADGSRRENAAEHSWHLALFAVTLSEWAAAPIDPWRVARMLILHDLVEIDCGDTPLFDEAGALTQAAREEQAARRLFGLLPADQGEAFAALWREFEAGETAEARFAKALDRLQPILLNHLVSGGTWLEYRVDEGRERSLSGRIESGAPALWRAAEAVFAEAVERGWLQPAQESKP